MYNSLKMEEYLPGKAEDEVQMAEFLFKLQNSTLF